jgi:hypothetical protein
MTTLEEGGASDFSLSEDDDIALLFSSFQDENAIKRCSIHCEYMRRRLACKERMSVIDNVKMVAAAVFRGTARQ